MNDYLLYFPKSLLQSFSSLASASIALAFSLLMPVSAPAAMPGYSDMVEMVERAHESLVDRAMEEAQAWLLEQPKPELRALGMIPAISAVEPLTAEASNTFFNDFSRVLSNQPKPAALHFLALACENSRIMPSCIDKGLIDSVRRVDPNNLATWSIVYRDQPEKLLDSIEQANYFDEFYAEAISGWMGALGNTNQPIAEFIQYVMPFMRVLAIAMPAFSSLTESCKIAVEKGPDSDLAKACWRTAANMRDQGQTLITRNIGHGLTVRLAEIEQSPDLAEHTTARQMFKDRMSCVGAVSIGTENDLETTRHYIRLLIEHGEVNALEIMADEQGIECDVSS